MSILITGGCGYIGSHLALKLLEKDEKKILEESISKKLILIDKKEIEFPKDLRDNLKIYKRNILFDTLDDIFISNDISIVIHLAGLKSVEESMVNPTKYFHENINITLRLIETMEKYNCRKMIFSSSATVYGNSEKGSYIETDQCNPLTPYGSSKRIIEMMLESLTNTSSWKAINLRYFNPIGYDKRLPVPESKNLMSAILDVLEGRKKKFIIYGNDYDTKDGTAVRDYIDIYDLVNAHIIILNNFDTMKELNYNVGSEEGLSVLEIVNKMNELKENCLPYTFCDRRAGDLASYTANTQRLQDETQYSINKNNNLTKICSGILNNL